MASSDVPHEGCSAVNHGRSDSEPSQPHPGSAPGHTPAGSGWWYRVLPRVARYQGDPARLRAHRTARSGDWPALRTLLTAVPDGPDRTRLLGAAADANGVETWIPRAIAEDPDPALAELVAGARHVSWAWEARTGARASQVSPQRFRIFHERLRIAEEHLYEAAERRPAWSSPWYFLQITARGLQLGLEIARARFAATERRSPGHLGGHQMHLQQLCRKWGGSHRQMHGFARASMLRAPAGSPLGTLVATAHVEHWLDTDCNDAYWRSPDIAAQLTEAAERSVLHPAYRPDGDTVASCNTFAMALACAGRRSAARRVFRGTGGVVTESPWHFRSVFPALPYHAARWRTLVGR